MNRSDNGLTGKQKLVPWRSAKCAVYDCGLFKYKDCGGGWSTPRTGRFMSGREARYKLQRAGLDGWRKHRPTPEFDSRTVQPVANRNTDWAIPAPKITKLIWLILLPGRIKNVIFYPRNLVLRPGVVLSEVPVLGLPKTHCTDMLAAPEERAVLTNSRKAECGRWQRNRAVSCG